MGILYEHYSEAPWDSDRWPNFSAKELSCPCCGEYYHDIRSLDALQMVRTSRDRALKLNSAHRCLIHNARVGGAPLSEHKKIAEDIRIEEGDDREELKKDCQEAGFTGFGHYVTFLHVDMGRPRWWISKGGRALWKV